MKFFSKEEEISEEDKVVDRKKEQEQDDRIAKLTKLTQEKNALEKKEITLLKKISEPMRDLRASLEECRMNQQRIEERIRSIKKSFR